LRSLCQLAAWFIAVIIVALHVVPATYRPVTAVSHNFEHLAIFLALGMAFGLGYPQRSRALAFALPLFCLAIEAVQLGIPGRHARLPDFLINTGAALLGLWIAIFVVGKVLARISPSRSKPEDDGRA
jgi:VanZ family protein